MAKLSFLFDKLEIPERAIGRLEEVVHHEIQTNREIRKILERRVEQAVREFGGK